MYMCIVTSQNIFHMFFAFLYLDSIASNEIISDNLSPAQSIQVAVPSTSQHFEEVCAPSTSSQQDMELVAPVAFVQHAGTEIIIFMVDIFNLPLQDNMQIFLGLGNNKQQHVVRG